MRAFSCVEADNFLGQTMNSTILLALGLVLVLEGLGPMLYPKAWRKMIQAMTQLPDATLRRFGAD